METTNVTGVDYAFEAYDPTINYHKFTLGDLLAATCVLATALLPLIWCCGRHRKRMQSQSEKEKENIADNELNISKAQLLQQLQSLQIQKMKSYNDNQKIEIEPLNDIDMSPQEEAAIIYEDIEHKHNDINNLSDEPSDKQPSASSFRRESISGPVRGSPRFTTFVITLVTMILAGSSNDFLGKLIYQMHPGNTGKLNGLHALKHEYWLTFALTAGSFFVCTFALCSKSARKSFKKVDTKLFLKITIPSIMDTIVTGGRYLGLVFLSAALISILKNGSQLLFLALLRRCFHGKKLLCVEWFGVGVIIVGLLVVAANKVYISFTDDDSDLSIKDSIIGIVIMISVGFAGAIRNDIEELLLKNDNLDSNFLVGLESAISLTFTMFIGVALFIIDPFNNIDEKHMFINMYKDILTVPAFIMIFVLFLIAIYGKDTMQMKMTALSSSLTRKLFQQIYPSCTWFISLMTFVITSEFAFKSQYGESWEGKYSWIRLSGFVVVAIGNCFYIKGHFIFEKMVSWVI